MELRPFIKQAICDIINGVTDAQDELPNGSIVPPIAENYKSVEAGVSRFQAVDFEIVVRVEQSKGSEAKLNVFTAVIGGGVKGQSGEEEGHSATLRFKVPISFPLKEEQKSA
jgi:hypothetical protein